MGGKWVFVQNRGSDCKLFIGLSSMKGGGGGGQLMFIARTFHLFSTGGREAFRRQPQYVFWIVVFRQRGEEILDMHRSVVKWL